MSMPHLHRLQPHHHVFATNVGGRPIPPACRQLDSASARADSKIVPPGDDARAVVLADRLKISDRNARLLTPPSRPIFRKQSEGLRKQKAGGQAHRLFVSYCGDYFFFALDALCLMAACAAAKRAMGTRNGEQLT